MVLHLLRALFVLLMAGVGWFFVAHSARPFGEYTWLAMTFTLVISVFIISIDILSPRRKLAVISGTFLGLLVGITIAWALSFAVQLAIDQFWHMSDDTRKKALVDFSNVTIGVICCYLAISFILQTKDDFRFIIPYVEFSKQLRGARPYIVDTSVIIDGRIMPLIDTGFIDSKLIIPKFILTELQQVADHSDRLKRNRGRRGLEILNKIQTNHKVEVIVYEWNPQDPKADMVNDERLMGVARDLNGRLLTNDYNLSKVAQVRGIETVNINDIATALRPIALPGERIMLKIVKPGEDPTQGVGYLDDGTLVVVEQARARIGQVVDVVITNSLQTPTGRIVFGKIVEEKIA